MVITVNEKYTLKVFVNKLMSACSKVHTKDSDLQTVVFNILVNNWGRRSRWHTFHTGRQTL